MTGQVVDRDRADDVLIRTASEIVVGSELAAQAGEKRVTSQVRGSNDADASVSGQY